MGHGVPSVPHPHPSGCGGCGGGGGGIEMSDITAGVAIVEASLAADATDFSNESICMRRDTCDLAHV